MINWLRLVSLQWNHSHTRLPWSYLIRWIIYLTECYKSDIPGSIKYLYHRGSYLIGNWKLLSILCLVFFVISLHCSTMMTAGFWEKKSFPCHELKLNICHHKIQHHDHIKFSKKRMKQFVVYINLVNDCQLTEQNDRDHPLRSGRRYTEIMLTRLDRKFSSSQENVLNHQSS